MQAVSTVWLRSCCRTISVLGGWVSIVCFAIVLATSLYCFACSAFFWF